ncbi:MAG TPA: hypothetical protein VFP97_03490 [Chitinophagaceae bacterium]|nr:hypothetical protein [Chitinophagaceae bacterium]
MIQKENIEQEIEKTLDSLNGIKRAEANPFLFTRITARLNRKSGGWDRFFSFASKPLVALAVLALVMAMNGWSYFDNRTPPETLVSDTETASLPEFEREYKFITSPDSYDFENANNE